MGPEAGPGFEGQKELSEELDRLGLSQAQGWGPLESKNLRRTRLCSTMPDMLRSFKGGEMGDGKSTPKQGTKWIGSEAGLKVRKPKAQLVKVFIPALLWLKANDGWPEWSWYPFSQLHQPVLQQGR